MPLPRRVSRVQRPREKRLPAALWARENVSEIDGKSIYPAPAGLLAALVLANVLGWVLAFALFGDRPAILGTASLAWVLGMRHAVDADHIAAIDNVVRKLVQDGKAAREAGLFFSLGHSTVVFMATFLVTVAAFEFGSDEGLVKSVGGGIGASVSAIFLLLIAGINLIIFIGLVRTLCATGSCGGHESKDFDLSEAGRGPRARLLGPVLRLVSKTWHMYPLGFLFGLGFDTATEIGLLSISAEQAARGLSPWSVLIFPALFAAAMTLVDTTDSVFMVVAYRWAAADPFRRAWYNLTFTGASVLVALLVGGIEALDLLGRRLGLDGGLWALAAMANESLTNLGIVVIAVFVLLWCASIGVYLMSFSERGS